MSRAYSPSTRRKMWRLVEAIARLSLARNVQTKRPSWHRKRSIGYRVSAPAGGDQM
jgi:hypothetical protein